MGRILKNYVDFDKKKTRIALEMGTSLEGRIQGYDIILKCHVVGMKLDDYIIIKIPKQIFVKNFQQAPPDGNSFIGKFTNSGTIFGFTSIVMGSVTEPDILLILSYPFDVKEKKLRAHQRVECFLPAKLSIAKAIMDGHITDLSKGGCKYSLRTDKLLKSGVVLDLESIKLSFLMPGISSGVSIYGDIKKITRDKEMVEFGIQFMDVPPDIEEMISEFIESYED